MADHREEYRNLHLEVTDDRSNIEEYLKDFKKILEQYFDGIEEGDVYLKIEAGRLGPPPPPPPPNGD